MPNFIERAKLLNRSREIQTLHRFQNNWIKICFATGFQQSTFNYDLYDKTTNGRIYFSKWTMTWPLQKAGM